MPKNDTPKPPKTHRSEPIKMLVTPDERAELAAAAERAGVPLATWVRMIALAAAR